MSNKSDFEKRLAPFQDGFFTHLYAECGYLDRSQPEFQFHILPENKDLFDLSSLTKALVTAPLIYQESLKKSLDLNDKTKVWLSEGSDPYDMNLNQISILNLLGHTSGLPAWRNFWTNHVDQNGHTAIAPDNRAKHTDRILNAQLLKDVGRFVYSDLGYLFLQRILELRHKANFAQIFAKFCQELQLGQDLTFAPAKNAAISTGYCPVRKRELVGEVHDENAFSLGGACGHAGAFASGEGLSRYLRKFLRTSPGQLLFAEQMNELECKDPNPGLRGWWHGNGESSRVFKGGNAMGHLGFTGTAFWIDGFSQAYGILLTNRIISGRTSPRITELRKSVFQFFDHFLQ